MATYGEPNYKFPTLARAVPNVTTGGTIMATVDLDYIKQRIQYGKAIPEAYALALIRRVERLTVALTQAEYDLCHFYDEPATHDKPIFQIRSEMRKALKEESDSVG